MELLKIAKADDSRTYYTTHISFSGLPDDKYGYSTPSKFGYRIENTYNRNYNEPMIEGIVAWLKTNMSGRRINENFSAIIKLGDRNNPYVFTYNKIMTRYNINGVVQTKDILFTALARVLFKSCFTSDPEQLAKYMWHHLHLPESVSYALENRAPYHWYKKGKKIDVRFNIKMISDDDCAIEISDGIWGQISIKNMTIYMNFYWKGKERGSWKYLSPEKLWVKLLNKEPTEGQLKVMEAFLEQNRTSDIVENRARELMADLQKQYSERIKICNKDEKTTMFIRGKIADWVLTDSSYKSEIQSVSTYIYHKGDANISGKGQKEFQKGKVLGPICIDNMTKHSSVGDQFAARALALLNDSLTIERVSTIKGYLNRKEHVEGQQKHRFNWDKLEYWVGI
tara:strand:+ start:1356 stop:2543 length:1188 start_codon:yes stop_codon:yes gene_type:complete